jgi:hypothetical protein
LIGFKALYCDVRQLLAYIKDVHGGIFRRVLLSGLLDSAARWNNRKTLRPKTVAISSIRNREIHSNLFQNSIVFPPRDCLQSTGDDCHFLRCGRNDFGKEPEGQKECEVST